MKSYEEAVKGNEEAFRRKKGTLKVAGWHERTMEQWQRMVNDSGRMLKDYGQEIKGD